MIPVSARGSLYNLLGPGSLSGLLFADLLDQMLILESATQHFKLTTPSDRAGDFAGVDALADVPEGRDLDGMTGRLGFQYKFYPSESQPLSKSHKSSIEESLTSVATTPYRPDCWILVTPEDFNKHQLNWLLGLKAKLGCNFEIRHWGQKRISALITKYPECAVHLYPELDRGMKPHSFRDMCVRLHRVLSSDKAHSSYHIDTRLDDGRTVTAALNTFLEGDQSLFCLLGGYGTGKTNALEHLTLQLSNLYSRGQFGRVPLLIRLRSVRGEGSFAHNVVAYIQREYGLDLDLTTLKALNAVGRTVIIMDGLDEKESYGDRRFAQSRLREVFEFLAPTGKLILASRTEFFKDSVEEWNIIFGRYRPHFISKDTPASVVFTDSRGVLAYISPLSTSLIKEYVTKRVGEDNAPAFFMKMQLLYDISEIAARPVLLDMVCSILPELVTREKKIFVTDIYSHYVHQQLEGDVISSRMSGDIDAKLLAIQYLAEQMIISGEARLHHQALLQKISLPESELGRDFLNTAFLVRDGLGYYEFSHRSFLEYFGAACMFSHLQPPFTSSEQWLHSSLLSAEQYHFVDEFVAAEWEHRLVSCAVGYEHHGTEMIDTAPVTVEAYRSFVITTGYSPIATVENSYGYAKVCWYDAVAYALNNGTRVPSTYQLLTFMHRHWPHSRSDVSEIPYNSIFSCSGPDKLGVLESAQGAITVREEREWSAMCTQIENGWMFKDGIRLLNNYWLPGAAAVNQRGLFRCTRGSGRMDGAGALFQQ